VGFVNHDVTHATGSDLAQALSVLDTLGEVIESLVLEAGEGGWSAATPAEGWDVATQVAHLHWTDLASLAAISDWPAFDALVAKAMDDPEGFADAGALELAERPREELLEAWRAGRAELSEALGALDPGEQIAWFGPPMRPKTMATARIMETFAHGYDIADGLADGSVPSAAYAPGTSLAGRAPGLLGTAAEEAALPFVARIGHKTRDFAYSVHGEQPPAEEFELSFAAPGGETVTFGPAGAAQGVSGPLRDFCLLVTQRVAPRDTDLEARGADAERWLHIAQSFAGLPGKGRG